VRSMSTKSGWWMVAGAFLVTASLLVSTLLALRSKTPLTPAPKEAASPFTQVYKEIAYFAHPKVIFLEPDDFGRRLAVVDYSLDSAHICLYTGISLEEVMSIVTSLRKGKDIAAVLKEVKHFKSFEFVDRDGDGFVGDCAQDKFFFGEGGSDVGGMEGGPSHVLASELDVVRLDMLNTKYLALLKEIVMRCGGNNAGTRLEEPNKPVDRLSAARDAIYNL